MRNGAAIVLAAALLVAAGSAWAEAPQPQTVAARQAPAEAARCDINKATLQQLDAVPGIGPKMAAMILELRAKKGAFTTLDDLLEVRGIGEKNLAKLKDYLCVVPQTPQPKRGP